MELFAGRTIFMEATPREGASRILYVGVACKRVALALSDAELSLDVDNFISLAAEVHAGDGP